MLKNSLYFKETVKFNKYSVSLFADDERIITAVKNWIDQDIARYHDSIPRNRSFNITLKFFTNPDHIDITRPPESEPTATFEHIEFYHSNNHTILVIRDNTLIDIDLNKNSARGYISKETLESQWALAHRVFYLPVLEILRNLGAYYVHAGCVCRENECILLCGGSGQGKSTTTYALVRSGLSYMSDDAIFVQKSNGGLEVFSFPEKIKLDKTSRSFFPEFGNFKNVTGKIEIPLKDTNIKKVSVSGRPHSLILTELTNSETSRISPVSVNETLLGLIRQSISLTSPDTIEDHLEILQMLCESSYNFRLKIGRDIAAFPKMIKDHLFE